MSGRERQMQELYADVIVDITSRSLDRVFQYRIPDGISLEPGMIVEIPFGKGNRRIRGYVTGVSGVTDYDPDKIKEIAAVITDAADEEARLVRLAVWIRQRYGSTMLQAMKTVIPVKQKVKGRQKRTLSLVMDRAQAVERLTIFRKKHQTARARLLEALLDEPQLPCELVTDRLGITAPVVRALAEQGILEIKSEKLYRNPIRRGERTGRQAVLNEEQQAAVDQITGEWERHPDGRYLLHGITGSGKTEVYMALIEYAVRRGEQTIVLIPEIALTYQTVLRFYRRFGDRVSVIHSRLSAGEKYDQFERARNGELDVMIGPRSALFTPFPRLGLIVIDEEHEPAYQSETMPRYHAREVAGERGRIEGAKVLLGSATPSMEAYYGAMTGEYRLLDTEAPGQRSEASCDRGRRPEERTAERKSLMISGRLHKLMEERLKAGQQIMLFLNRRGYAGFVSCRSCGHVMKCPHCDVSLSLHGEGRLVCHYCGYSSRR